MTSEQNENIDDISEEDLDKLDADLLQVEILYKSRCVQAPTGKNVTVREIIKDEK